MFITRLNAAVDWFDGLGAVDHSHPSVMNLEPGEAMERPATDHHDRDQVLLLVEGEMIAEVGEERARMRSGDVVVIPAGISHRFHNTGNDLVRAFTVYASPANFAGAR